MSPRSRFPFVPLAAVVALAACAPDAPTGTRPDVVGDRAGWDQPGAHRQYGVPSSLGRGKARTYVVLDEKAGTPLEIGVALDAKALDGLPDEGRNLVLPLPRQAFAPWDFALVDWNPQGHEPPGVYDVPHFDFHFYRTPVASVMAILPTAPDFAANANDVPTGGEVPPFYAILGPPGAPPVASAVPQMGVHWVDLRSPELQGLLGNPGGYQPFTKTFIYGSWAGDFTFLEPMITREYLQSQPSEVIPLPVPAAYPEAGWYPTAYRIAWDAQQKEYRVALTSLVRRE